jgi:hypothetical protein
MRIFMSSWNIRLHHLLMAAENGEGRLLWDDGGALAWMGAAMTAAARDSVKRAI